MDYAIVLYMNEKKTGMVKSMISELASECGSDYCVNIKPHVTIASIISDDEKAIKEEVKKISVKIKHGEIKVASIGIFNPFVLYLAPIVDLYLLEACQIANDMLLKVSDVGNQGRYTPFNWVPHMAVAMKMDREGLYRSFNRLSELFTPFIAEIDKLALIKCEQDNPYQELAVYDLK